MRVVYVTLIVVLASPIAGAAQDHHLNMFLYEKSYAALGTPDVSNKPSYYTTAVAEPELLAEAQFAAHLPLHRGLNDQELREGQGGWGFNWFLTSQFRVRALDVPSGPIRSPSFMPKFTLQWLKSTGRGTPESGPRAIWGVSIAAGHHSNGGESCVFVDQERANDCMSSLDPVPSAEDREIRVRNGNFSTNYVALGGGMRQGRITDKSFPHWPWAIDVALSLQLHHDYWFPLPVGSEDDFDELYGAKRIIMDISGHKLFWKTVAVRAWGRLDVFSSSSARFESELMLQRVDGLQTQPRGISWIPDFVGLGLRYAWGQDYYNTQFVRDISHLQFAVFVNPWSPSATK